MGIIGAIQNFFARSDSPPIPKHEKIQKTLKEIENRKSQAQLKLFCEKEKPDPDLLMVDRLEREVRMCEQQRQRFEERLKHI